MPKPFTHSEQYELWQDLSRQNRHLRRNNWFHWAVHLALVLALFLMATRPLLAVRVDSLGAASLVTTLAPSNAPGPEEAEAITRAVATDLLEVTSGSVARDIGRATALMTVDFARAYRAKVQEDPALTQLERGNIRTQLTLDSSNPLIKAERGADGAPIRYHVQLTGRLDVFRADAYTAPLLSRNLTVRATLLIVPRTRTTLNGLLVSWFDREFETYRSAPNPTPTPSPIPAPSSTVSAP